jgi:tetratricopeptide (TPR) repeat protein/DNA-binding SARP family transcriptional activator
MAAASGGIALVEFQILGPTRLRADNDGLVSLGPTQQRGFLALLLYRVRQPVPVTLIIERLWGEPDSERRRKQLHVLASRVRGVFKNHDVPGTLHTIRGSDHYRLDLDPQLIDYHDIRRVVEQAREAARTGDHAAAATMLIEALARWHEPPLAELRSTGAEHDRYHLRERVLLGICKSLFESQLVLHEYEAVIARLEPLIETRSLDETLVKQWITALDGIGRFAEGIDYYLNFRRRWRQEVGAEPSVEVQETYMNLLTKRKQSHPESAVLPGATPSGFTPPSQLPRDITDFVGHDQLLRDLDALADPKAPAVGVIMIDGAPGVGKTTTVVHWARRHLDWFPDGQLFVNANAFGAIPPADPDDMLGHFLHSLGVPADRIPPGGDERRTQLSQRVSDRKLLIVVDNALDSQQIRPLLAATGACLMIITSRTTLTGLAIRDGMKRIRVATLTTDESVSMLNHAIGPERAGMDRLAVEKLAEMSSGIPLALRIIGHHAADRPMAPLSELVDQLRSQLLAPEDEFDEDEATVRTVLTWSYRALPAMAALLFRMLGLHPGRSIGVGAAAALLGQDLTITERLLDLLARMNLLEHDTTRRYRLHDLLRRYAADRATDQESPDHLRNSLERMLDWYLVTANNAASLLEPQRTPVPGLPLPETVEAMGFPDDNAGLNWYEVERENITAAVECAAQNGFHDHAWKICGAAHEALDRFGNQDDLLHCHEIALSAAQTLGNMEAQWGTLNNMGGTCFRLGHYRQAAMYFESSIAVARNMKRRGGRAVCLLNLGTVHLELGNVRSAIDLFQQALREYDRDKNLLGVAVAHHRLGNAFRHLKRYDEALTSYERALQLHETIGSQRGQGTTHAEIAALHLELGQLSPALEHGHRALKLHIHTNDHTRTCEVLITLAAAYRRLGRHHDALESARRAAGLTDEIADSRRRAKALALLADLFNKSGLDQ